MTYPVDSKNGAITFGAFQRIRDKMRQCDAFLIGPGLSVTADTVKLVCELTTDSDIPLIIDADGINAISENPDILKKIENPVILTPHVGEFSRLIGKPISYILENKESLGKEFALEYGVILVLKSHETLVCHPSGEIFTNILGNPGMAVGGSGDVLAGMIASFVAQKNDPLTAALSGVYFHSLAADMAVEEFGEYSLIPTDIIEYLPHAILESRK